MINWIRRLFIGSLAGILNSLESTVDKLHAFAELARDEAVEKDNYASILSEQAHTARVQADRADRVAGRVNELIA